MGKECRTWEKVPIEKVNDYFHKKKVSALRRKNYNGTSKLSSRGRMNQDFLNFELGRIGHRSNRVKLNKKRI